MHDGRRSALEKLIESATGSGQPIVSSRGCSGGCINRAEIVLLADGRELFVKSNRNGKDWFAQEAIGLSALQQTGAVRVPRVIAMGPLDSDEDCLVLEAIRTGAKPNDFWPRFGEALAELHRLGTASAFGWSSDNYLGSNRQPNTWCDDWCRFWGQHRLEFQLRLARENGLGSSVLFRECERLIQRLDQIIAVPADPPSLLHGDLWSGNYLVDESGRPVLIDPAVYYGRREADLAMPLLFGGFPEAFFDGYCRAWPLEHGWKNRAQVYKLYHLLNHLNLFGQGYLESCLDAIRRIG
jgi:protein-ribulosamine 3-kinase